jgi:hypothetical protein
MAEPNYRPASRSMPTSTARSVRSSSQSISKLDRWLAVRRGLPVRRRDGLLGLAATALRCVGSVRLDRYEQ